MTRPQVTVVLTLLLAAPWAGCGTEWSPDVLAHGSSPVELARLQRGRDTFGVYCIGCHGEQGDGAGPAARFMTTKPRDFRKCQVKFASVPSGELPRDADYIDTISHGLAGTAMPRFNLLSREDGDAVIAYVRTFCPKKNSRPGVPVRIDQNPWWRTPQAGVAEGERVYHAYGRCWSCHPAYVTKAKLAEHLRAMDMPVVGFRPNLYVGAIKDSDWGAPIPPPNFLADRIKTGNSADRLVRVIAAGVGGTAMPTWAGGISNRQLWGIALYVESLAAMRGTADARALRDELAGQSPWRAPADTDTPSAVAPDDNEQGGAQ